MVEVAEYKAKLRKLRQQLEEKTEQWSEVREEHEKLQEITDKLKSENLELCQDARAAKTYRDELDVLRERAEKVDKLEAELLRYKDKMNDIEFFKSRVEELREDNRILVETKEMLEEQLASARKRSERILELENDIIRFKGEIERFGHEKDNDRARIKDLQEENAALLLSQKTSLNESQVNISSKWPVMTNCPQTVTKIIILQYRHEGYYSLCYLFSFPFLGFYFLFIRERSEHLPLFDIGSDTKENKRLASHL